jgi:hypothetical protein
MNFDQHREWLARKLARNDDTGAAAGGTPLGSLRFAARVASLRALLRALGRIVAFPFYVVGLLFGMIALAWICAAWAMDGNRPEDY